MVFSTETSRQSIQYRDRTRANGSKCKLGCARILLEVDGLGVRSHGSLLEGLRESRVGVAGSGNVLCRSLVLDGENSGSNHLTSIGANDVNTKNLVSLLLDEELDDTVGIGVGLGTRVGKEGELAHLELNTLLLELLLVLSDPSDLGVGVDDGGNGSVVDVAVASLDDLDSSNTLLLGLVGKHGTESGVTNALDTLAGGVVLVVDNDASSLVLLDSDSLEVEAAGDRSSADGDKNNVSVELSLLAALGVLDVEHDLAVLLLGVDDLGTHAELDALLLERLLEALGDLAVDTGTTDSVQELNNLDVGAKTAPDTAHLETDNTGTDDNHLLGDLLELKSAGGADNLLLVDLDAGEGSDLGTSSDDDVLGLDLGLAAVVESDLDSGGAAEATGTLDIVDLVLLEETLDTLGETSDGARLGLEHGLEVERDGADVNPAVLEVVLSLVVEVRVVQHGLGRDASDVEAGTSKRATLLDTGGLETELSSLDGGDITTGTTADDDDIVWVSTSGETTALNTREGGNNAGERRSLESLVAPMMRSEVRNRERRVSKAALNDDG